MRFDLNKDPVHLSTQRENSFEVLKNFSFSEQDFSWQYIGRLCSPDDPGCVDDRNLRGQLANVEVHPEGDELVIILSGRGTFLHETEAGNTVMAFSPGDAILNPKGVWHTADIEETLRAIHITTCPGTDHKPR